MRLEYLHLQELLARADLSDAGVKVWVPSETIAIYRLDMPGGSQRKWRSLVPWMLEERLLGDPLERHYVLGPKQANNEIWVAVVPRSNLEDWLDQARSKCDRVLAMAPDFLALPWQADTITLLAENNRWLVRYDSCQGFCGPPNFCLPLIAQRLRENPHLRLSCIGSATDLPPELESKATRIAEHLNWSFPDYPDSFNLLTDSYRSGLSFSRLRFWWPSLAISGLCLLLALALGLVDLFKRSAEIPGLEQEVSRVYQSYFGEPPGDVGSVHRQAEHQFAIREQQYLATRSKALQLLQVVDPVLSSCSDCDIRSVQTTDAGLVITLNVDSSVAARLKSVKGASVQIDHSGDALVLTLRLLENQSG